MVAIREMWKSFFQAIAEVMDSKSRRQSWNAVSKFVESVGAGKLAVMRLHMSQHELVAAAEYIPNKRLNQFWDVLPASSKGRRAIPALFSNQSEHVSNIVRVAEASQQRHLIRLARLTGGRHVQTLPLDSPSHGRYCVLLFAPMSTITPPLSNAILTLCYAALEERFVGPVVMSDPGYTQRELECVQLLVSGLEDSEIAARIGISARTVRYHVDNAKDKAGVKSRVQLIAKLAKDSFKQPVSLEVLK